jgi:hypothetical protein
MTSRFQRGKTGVISPFFAFQDIITSAMAVLIAIIMLLALYMGGAASHESADPETPALAARLKAVLDELANTQAEMRSARESDAADQSDPALIQGQILALRHELDAVRGETKSNKGKAQEIRESDPEKGLRKELESERAKNSKTAAELEQLEKEAERSRQEMDRLESEVRNEEAALLQEQSRSNQLWVIPDRSASSKEPVLAVISGNEATLQRFDNPEKQIVNGSRLRSGFAEALKSYSPLNQYVVFYFKPSGADHFKRLTQETKDAGFEIGYDAINEDVAINFTSPK